VEGAGRSELRFGKSQAIGSGDTIPRGGAHLRAEIVSTPEFVNGKTGDLPHRIHGTATSGNIIVMDSGKFMSQFFAGHQACGNLRQGDPGGLTHVRYMREARGSPRERNVSRGCVLQHSSGHYFDAGRGAWCSREWFRIAGERLTGAVRRTNRLNVPASSDVLHDAADDDVVPSRARLLHFGGFFEDWS